MSAYDVTEAQAKLPELIAAALKGEPVVILQAGQPAVQLAPCPQRDARASTRRRPGTTKVWMSDDFDAPLGGAFDAAFRGALP